MSRSKSPKKRQKNPGGRSGKPSSAAARGLRSDKANSAKDGWLYGDHAVLAAVANPARKIKRLVLTKSKFDSLDDATKGYVAEKVAPEILDKDIITGLLLENALHQGIAALPYPLPERTIADLPNASEKNRSIVAILDQVTDPHNVGAILRSAAAFGVDAAIMPDRNSPPITGVLARAASGAVDMVPIIHVGNLSRALDQLAEKGYWRIGLDGRAEQTLETAATGLTKVALVLGSEGKGLRQLTAQKCDLLAKLPISSKIESLNVSNAAAIAFYELERKN